MYLTYAEYQTMGGTLDEATFNNLEFQAECEINWVTFDRLENETEIPEKVKRCMYSLIALLNEVQQAYIVNPVGADGNIQAAIASQSNDGVSTSFNTLSASDAAKLIHDKIVETIQKQLSNVTNSLGRKLLYRGLYPGE